MTSVKTCSLARRDVVRGAAALALSAALGPMVVNRAQADESAVVPNVLSGQFATGRAWNGGVPMVLSRSNLHSWNDLTAYGNVNQPSCVSSPFRPRLEGALNVG